MSAVFDGKEIWSDKRTDRPPMTKEDQEKWDRIQEHCKKMADDMVKHSYEIDRDEIEESVGC